MTNDRELTNDRERTGDWNRTDWAGEGQGVPGDARTGDAGVAQDPGEPAGSGDRWNKTQWVGDQGEGAPVPEDPDLMPEGERGLSGDRHNPGEEHWSRGQASDRSEAVGDRPLDRS